MELNEVQHVSTEQGSRGKRGTGPSEPSMWMRKGAAPHPEAFSFYGVLILTVTLNSYLVECSSKSLDGSCVGHSLGVSTILSHSEDRWAAP